MKEEKEALIDYIEQFKKEKEDSDIELAKL